MQHDTAQGPRRPSVFERFDGAEAEAHYWLHMFIAAVLDGVPDTTIAAYRRTLQARLREVRRLGAVINRTPVAQLLDAASPR